MMTTSPDHDACGVGFIAQLGGGSHRAVVERALTALERLSHRGGVDADGWSGDGAGLLTQIPVQFFRTAARAQKIELPERFAVGMFFFPPARQDEARASVAAQLAAEGLVLLGWREPPIQPDILGPRALATLPAIGQAWIAPGTAGDFGRRLFLARKRLEKFAPAGTYAVSLSELTIVYKGLLAPWQLPLFYPDLADPLFASAFAVFHQRYSTNTQPSWHLAQPFRFLGHNGEINTIGGNRRWLACQQSRLRRRLQAGDWFQSLETGVSDSASLDNALELLTHQGYNSAAALYRLIPPAWENDPGLPGELRNYLQEEAAAQEPWDGPAAIIFSDGRLVGARLDRNGLRPLRYTLTGDGLLVVGSETGIADFSRSRVLERNRLGPGEMILADPLAGHLIRPHDVPRFLGLSGNRQTYVSWPVIEPAAEKAPLSAAPAPGFAVATASGLTQDQCKLLLFPMLESGKEAVFSMGDDAPPAFASKQARLPWDFCKQRFAQVTNPPIDSLRETRIMSLEVHWGRAKVKLPSPLLEAGQVDQIRELLPEARLDMCFPSAEGLEAARKHLDGLRREAAALARRRPGFVLLSDRSLSSTQAALPVLLATSAVWEALAQHDGFDIPLIVETSQVWDTHQLAMLVAVGASAVLPTLAWQIAAGYADGEKHFRLGIETGLRKVLAKMGISTIASYRNSHLFEVVGVDREVTQEFFRGASAHLTGHSLDAWLREALDRHAAGFNGKDKPEISAAAGATVTAAATPTAAESSADAAPASAARQRNPLELWSAGLRDAGLYRYRHGGEEHSSAPDLIRRFHAFVRAPKPENWRAYAAYLAQRPELAARHWLRWRGEAEASLPPAPAELVRDLLSRFSTQAMSLGAISPETHRVLALAMNRLGARSNTGEGGEDPAIYTDEPEANNRIKQVASARFGVTANYLLHADEIEIKMAQGSKPGEGGQLPPSKVSAYIARLRHAVPGMALISPPPHHDIYSIEDLAQLIHDLKSINPAARIGVKLVSGAGVGIIAAGVAKAGAHVITISGFDGGTGASPLTSIKNTALPWEVGLRDAHNMLLRSGFRSRVRLRVDGGFKSGRDVVVGALLGADEFGFGTASLLAVGCVMARQCHLNTCPVGIATQEEKLRRRFVGTPEMVMAFFQSVAEEAAMWMAHLGAQRLEDLIGHSEWLEPRDPAAARALEELLAPAPLPPASADAAAALPAAALKMAGAGPLSLTELNAQHGPSLAPLAGLDERLSVLLEQGPPEADLPLRIFPISNRDRSVGARLTRNFLQGESSLPAGSAHEFHFHGVAGQSFGAFLAGGLRFHLLGEANDYVGKCLSGGEIIIAAGEAASRRGDVLVGNTCLYGATGGRLYVAGRAGERFAVRNSGAWAVAEGAGLHCCEYMTAGLVVLLGPTGANFGSGMTGGLAYIPRDFLPEFHWHEEYVRVAEISPAEESQLRQLLETHYALTASPRAARLLSAAGRLALARVQPLRLPQSIEETWRQAPALENALTARSTSAIALALQ